MTISMTLQLFKILWLIVKIKFKKYRIQVIQMKYKKVLDSGSFLRGYKYKITKHNLKDTVILMRQKGVKDQQNH